MYVKDPKKIGIKENTNDQIGLPFKPTMMPIGVPQVEPVSPEEEGEITDLDAEDEKSQSGVAKGELGALAKSTERVFTVGAVVALFVGYMIYKKIKK